MRHVSKTHRVALDWLFHRINLDPKIQLKYIDTKNQLADTLTKGNFTRDEWTDVRVERTTAKTLGTAAQLWCVGTASLSRFSAHAWTAEPQAIGAVATDVVAVGKTVGAAVMVVTGAAYTIVRVHIFHSGRPGHHPQQLAELRRLVPWRTRDGADLGWATQSSTDKAKQNWLTSKRNQHDAKPSRFWPASNFTQHLHVVSLASFLIHAKQH